MAFEALKRGAAFVTLVARNEVSNRNPSLASHTLKCLIVRVCDEHVRLPIHILVNCVV